MHLGVTGCLAAGGDELKRGRRKGQPGGCRTCGHAHRSEIEMLHARGVSLRALAAKFDLTSGALGRHMIRHVTAEARASYLVGADVDRLGELVIEENGSVLRHYAAVRSALYRHFDSAGGCQDRIN